jgi:hypothetical protein
VILNTPEDDHEAAFVWPFEVVAPIPFEVLDFELFEFEPSMTIE